MKNKGITLIALVITIVILMILAGISIGALTGDNGIINQTRDAKENTEIQEEREAVDISAVEAANKNRFGTITQENLQKALDNYVGKGETTVNDMGDNILIVTFNKTGRIYEVNKDGIVEYLGRTQDLLNKIIISVDKERDTSPKYVQEVEIQVKTYVPIESMTIRYAWTKSQSEEPAESEYCTASSVNISENKLTRTTSAFSDKTEEGNYYLWIQAIIDESGIDKRFGEYAIKENTTLRSCTGEQNSTSPFLGNSDIQRRFVKSVKIVPTLDGHVKGEGTCWDVSESQKGSILAWYTEEIIDDTTFYNVTHRKS